MGDKLGRQKTIFIFIISNAIIHILIALLLNLKSLADDVQWILFMILRMLSGTSSYMYTTALVLIIELCGASKRLFAVNLIYYFFVAGEFFVVLFSYFIREYNWYFVANSIFLTSFVSYFW